MTNRTERRRRPAFAAGLATLAMALGFTAIPADAAPPPRADYVALGDSYTAGTGAGPFSTPFPCLQTDGGYVNVAGNTGRLNLLANEACHGALLFNDGTSPIPSVSEQISAASVDLAAAELVSITAGANDINFSFVVLTCATESAETCNAAVQEAQGKITSLVPQLIATYGQIRQAAPTARIVVLGYPRLFDASIGVPGIDSSVLTTLNQATDLLNATIAFAASNSGAQTDFVDVTARFSGHEANSADSWLVFDRFNLLLPQNLHPNGQGHSLGYAAALMGAAKPARLARR